MDTLEIYQGKGMVRLLNVDRANATFLIERISPGTELSELADDDAATRIVGRIIRELRRPVPQNHTFPHLTDWAKVFERYKIDFANNSGPLSMSLVDKAAAYFMELSASAEDAVLLHGDLHHFNVLQAGGEQWVAIDPKGVIGDRVFETARFLHNPYPDFLKPPNLERLFNRRIDIICEQLGFDKQRF